MASDELNTLIEKHKAAIAEEDPEKLASLENKIFAEWKREGGKGSPRTWLVKELNIPVGHFETRVTLWRAGKAAAPLWDGLRKKTLTHGAASTVLRKAKLAATDEQTSLSDAVKGVLDEKPVDRVKASVSSDHVQPTDKQRYSKQFKKQLIKDAREFVELQGRGLDPDDVEYIAEELADMVKLAFEDAKKGLTALRVRKRESDNHKKVGRQRFISACRALNLSLTWGKPFSLRGVQHRKNKRVKDLHPDKHAGDHSFQEELDDVLEAYKTLQQHHKERYGTK